MSIVSALHTCCIHLDIDSVTFKLMYAYVQIKRWLAAVIFQLTETKFERNIIMNTLTKTEINVMKINFMELNSNLNKNLLLNGNDFRISQQKRT